MAQDMEKGRRTEIEFMNGFIASEGARVGVAAPTHEMLTGRCCAWSAAKSWPDRKTSW